jgi:hypothetical protein
VGVVQIRIGDHVRVHTAPNVEEQLWDQLGLIAALRPDNRVIVAFPDGKDCCFNPDQLELVESSTGTGRDPNELFRW